LYSWIQYTVLFL